MARGAHVSFTYLPYERGSQQRTAENIRVHKVKCGHCDMVGHPSEHFTPTRTRLDKPTQGMGYTIRYDILCQKCRHKLPLRPAAMEAQPPALAPPADDEEGEDLEDLPESVTWNDPLLRMWVRKDHSEQHAEGIRHEKCKLCIYIFSNCSLDFLTTIFVFRHKSLYPLP